jgi:3-methyladenine DNA glycosylase AlkD
MQLEKLKKELNKKANEKKAKDLAKFFKTQKGEYGEGDKFLGIVVPEQRKILKKYDLDLKEIGKLLKSEWHEERVIGVIALVEKYKKAKKESNELEKKNLFNFYLNNLKGINNWDLVDISCPKIVGDYLLDKKEKRKILYKLAKTPKKKNSHEWLWKKRIGIISTFAFIRKEDLEDAYKLAEMLLGEEHDLMHKAVGWTLRECGKKDEKKLKYFLKKYYKKIPRTTLRYAIEKFEEKERKHFIKGEFK